MKMLLWHILLLVLLLTTKVPFWIILVLALLAYTITLFIHFYKDEREMTVGLFSLALCILHLAGLLITRVIIAADLTHNGLLESMASSSLTTILVLPLPALAGFVLSIIELIQKTRNIPLGIAGLLFNLISCLLGIVYALEKALDFFGSLANIT